MAIAKIINYKDSGEKALLGAIDYCRNPVKADKTPFRMTGISDDPVKAFKLNKLLHHKESAKRLFKVLVISMEAEWPASKRIYGMYIEKMQKLMAAASSWWAQKGFQSTGAIHCNTSHPHFHLVIDTCNAQTGKQLSQSPRMLSEFKDAMSAAMQKLALGEEVLQYTTISEEAYFAEDDERFELFFTDDDSTPTNPDLDDDFSDGASIPFASDTLVREKVSMVEIVDHTLPFEEFIKKYRIGPKEIPSPACQSAAPVTAVSVKGKPPGQAMLHHKWIYGPDRPHLIWVPVEREEE